MTKIISRGTVLIECKQRINAAEQMVTHYEILGQEDNKQHMQEEAIKWEYVFNLIEEDIVQHPTRKIEWEEDESIANEEFSP